MKRRFSSVVVAGAFLALLGGRGIELLAQVSYKEINVKDAGSIRGTVQLLGNASKAGRLECSKDANICGKSKASPRLCVGKNNGVQNAIVYLEGIGQGKKFPAGMKAVLDQRKCEYDPHVMILPMGRQLEIVNNDPILHNVHAYDEQNASRTIFNIAQPIKGQHTPLKMSQMLKPGLVLMTCDAGHPWMSGYVMVAEHPYYAVTNASGSYVLDNVPPGSYKIQMWHEGVSVIKTELENGKVKKYIFEEPYMTEKEVTVLPNGTVTQNFELALR